MILIINSDKLIENYIARPISQKYCVIEEPHYNKSKFLRRVILIMTIIKIFFLINKYKVKAVVTLNHNSQFTQRMSKTFSSINFYFIQNGNTSKRELIRPFKNDITNFFCFGDYEKIVFEEFGHKAKNFIPVGNFRSSIYLHNSKLNSSNKYKIAFISQLGDWAFEAGGDNTDDRKLQKKLGLELFNYLIKFSKKHNLKMSVACRGNDNSLEYNFFKTFIKDDLFEVFTQKKQSTYDIVNKSELIISIFSTVNIEALKFNKKTLMVDCSEDNRYAYYNKNIFYSDIVLFNEKSLNNLEKKILYILNLKSEKYKKEVNKFSNLVLSNDKLNKPTFLKIREKIIYDNFN